MRLLIAVALALITACCASLPDRAADSRAAVVRLEMVGGGVCTGTAIGPTAILTAAHCIHAEAGAFTINGKQAGFVVEADDGHDHLILRVTQRQAHIAELGPEPRPGDRVFLWGNPAGLKDVLRFGRAAGKVERHDCIALPSGPCVMLLFDSNNTQGDSGAAIFDVQGRIVAVSTGGLEFRGWRMAFAYPMHFTPAQLAAARL